MRIAAILTGALLLSAATPSPAGEHLARAALPGFVEGYAAANATQSIREEIPQGETIEAWTRMVTTQRFGGLADRASPANYLGNVAAGMARACPGGRTTAFTPRTLAGRAGATMRADCPYLASTGKPETFIIVALPGAHDMHVRQVAFRRVPTNADLAWAEVVLAGVRLCAAGSPMAGC
ncbi:hypothetical protein [Novosphingobium sp. Gsoil 351]|uniref:hypothetical protein n=1 Tax=Novosphingobium sp. Gsoil 351 TaxID=2675225 RepID=UPI0012B45428|nr:hypothetical protein [Novosphingobium sp. Gsoil 351]QGN53736.1 hypothetical protein GKE62_03445 [Novosphingobium sp. Gsoil 351]